MTKQDGTKPAMSRKWLVTLIILAMIVSFASGIFAGSSARPVRAADTPGEFQIFWEVWDAVVSDFVDRDKIDFTEMTYGAIRGMLATLGDENHTVFFTPEEAAQQESAMEGSFEGIGAYVAQEDGVFRIVTPMHGSPAEAAGLVAGDIVLAVNGEDITGQLEWEIIGKIRGPSGTSIMLTILHPDADEPIDVVVERGTIEIESILWAPIPGTDLVYLQITQFADDTADELEKALTEINANETPFQGMLLDLRNNPGGYVHVLNQVASQFMPEDSVVMYERDADQSLVTHSTTAGGLATEIPMVVLINPGTASAGEILAGSLQQNGRAKLVGESTLGTGTVLRPFTMSDGSVLRLGVTNWLTPNQELLKDTGVTPDYNVTLAAETPMLDAYVLDEIGGDTLGTIEDTQFRSGLTHLRIEVNRAARASE